MAYCNIGLAHADGRGVEIDIEKAKYYFELAAVGGHVVSRHNLGCFEEKSGNLQRAIKHFMLSAGAGYDLSLEAIRECFMSGDATKTEFEKALRAHKE